MVIETPHLRLRPCSPAQLLALIDQPERFERVAGFAADAGLREMFTCAAVSPDWLAALRGGQEADPWHHGFFLIHRDSGVAIGTAGFKGSPDPSGMVEIAYGIASDFRCRGYATEAATALVAFAFDKPLVGLIRGHTLPTINASTSVLSKCGFQRVGDLVDPEDGPVWRWERRR